MFGVKCISQGTWRKDWALGVDGPKEVVPVVGDCSRPRTALVFTVVLLRAVAWNSSYPDSPGYRENSSEGRMERGASFPFYAPGTVLSCFVHLASLQPYGP